MQVSLPIVSNEDGKWNCVRLGFMALRQDFRLANHWKGYLTGGSFSNDRQGLAAGIGYFSANGRWTVEGGGGITGSAHFYGSEWKMSQWKRVNGQISVCRILYSGSEYLGKSRRRSLYLWRLWSTRNSFTLLRRIYCRYIWYVHRWSNECRV